MKCKNCGSEMDENIRTCPSCGKDVLYGIYVTDEEWSNALSSLKGAQIDVSPKNLKIAVDRIRENPPIKPIKIMWYKICALLSVNYGLMTFAGISEVNESFGIILWIFVIGAWIFTLLSGWSFFWKVRDLDNKALEEMKVYYIVTIVLTTIAVAWMAAID